MFRPTKLAAEFILRTEMRIIEAKYYSVEGIRAWDVCKQHLPSITAHLAAIDAALRRYKARRIDRGWYYLRPMADSVSFCIRSPLNSAPGASRVKALDSTRCCSCALLPSAGQQISAGQQM
ncbi:hypothetical protein BAE44_0013992 [Dichanthelium oligosanthes]|uniref:Uncharacterized protein n=1 Tax=Dichanthelium oligosanthes TaxID=888268 RepID=A0A1E5VIP2_9POAL|nr:hypothetical protein BAE44_0013992 [Dichanthelium oligosanthes]